MIITPMMGLRDVATLAPQLPVSLVRHMRSVCDERKPKKTGNGGDETVAAADNKRETETGGEVANMDGEKVAQLFVTHPLLVHGRKFDIRVYVFVRSFQVNELYEYDCKISLTHSLIHLTFHSEKTAFRSIYAYIALRSSSQ